MSAAAKISASAPMSAIDYVRDKDLDRRCSEAKADLEKMLANMSQTQKNITELQERNKDELSASRALDARWEKFKRDFDEANKQLISTIAGSIGAEGLLGVAGGIGGRAIKSQKSNSWYEDFTIDERESVFGGDISLKGFCSKIRNGSVKNIVVMCGAGISVSAGIPDFRSKGGLYESIKKEFGMSDPQSLFDIQYFKKNPKPFAKRAKEMLPGKFSPTPTHNFIKLLMQKDMLQRCYTQNIDTLEKLADIPDEKMVYAHGSFADCHCIECRHQIKLNDWRKDIDNDAIPKCPLCDGLVKPDIVFFGEDLPQRFATLRKSDFAHADALIVLGTSLKVGPFNSLITLPLKHKGLGPRVLINNEKVGTSQEMGAQGFRFDDENNFRDLFLDGQCDDIVKEICAELGWSKELEAIERTTNAADGWELMVKNQELEEEHLPRRSSRVSFKEADDN